MHKRIAVVEDPQLRRAIESVADLFDGVAKATIVHDLAITGAEALLRERSEEQAALERLVALSTVRDASLDWDVLEGIDEHAWGT
jgi:hypothetical protein